MNQVDLTLNRDFSRSNSNSRNVLLSNSLLTKTIREKHIKVSKNIITDSEINTNFLTGSIDDIKRNTSSLKIYRSLNEIEPICIRCGDILLNKNEELCDKCNNHLEQEFAVNKVMDLLKK
jgi:hypothetical protein